MKWIFYTKIHERLLRPLLAANSHPPRTDLRDTLRAIDRHVKDYTDHARLNAAENSRSTSTS
jgi:hypothetical protein